MVLAPWWGGDRVVSNLSTADGSVPRTEQVRPVGARASPGCTRRTWRSRCDRPLGGLYRRNSGAFRDARGNNEDGGTEVHGRAFDLLRSAAAAAGASDAVAGV